MTNAERQARNQPIIDAFRADNGIGVAPRFGLPDVPLLLLTTTGARSGQPRTSPLGYLPDGGRWIVFAANGGRPNRPAWYHNLVAHPDATIEVGGAEGIDTIAVHADELPEGARRDDLWARQAAVVPAMTSFAQTAPFVIPVLVLTRRHG